MLKACAVVGSSSTRMRTVCESLSKYHSYWPPPVDWSSSVQLTETVPLKPSRMYGVKVSESVCVYESYEADSYLLQSSAVG